MIAGENQNIIRIICFHVIEILINGVRGSCIPLTVGALLVRRKDGYASHITVQIPGDTDADMCIQSQRLILGQHPHSVYSGINTVAQRKINNTILAAKSYSRFCNLCRKNSQSTALSARQQHGNHFLFKHCVTSFLVRCIYYTIYLFFANIIYNFFLIFYTFL